MTSVTETGEDRRWSKQLGPKPGELDCLIPGALLSATEQPAAQENRGGL